MIITTQNISFTDLIKKARIKFDSYVDPLQMGQQLLKVTELIDFPTVIIDLPKEKWQKFWLNELQKLKTEVLQ